MEPAESSLEAVRRESLEEAGAILKDVQYIGCYQITERREVRWADCYVSLIDSLVEIGMKEESNGRRFATLNELPEFYHLWNPLTQMVFEHAKEVIDRQVAR